MRNKEIIPGVKFFLRKFQKEDAIELFHALGDERVVRHIASEGISLQDCKDIVADAEVHWNKHSIGSYGVVDKATNQIVGWAGFKFWKEEEFEIVIVLSPKAWGYGKELCDILVQKAKDEFLLKKIYVLLPETRKSFKWIEKKGFSFCGIEVFNNQAFKKFVKVL